jgi:prepilin-type N-terminal cleavage/methylation domain-containing protein
MKKGSQKGFTFVELMTVVAVIVLLTSIAIPSIQKIQARNRDAKRIQDLKLIANALEQYQNDKGYYPHSGVLPPYNCTSNPPPTPGDDSCPTEESAVDAPGYFLEELAPYFPNGEVPVDPINETCYFDNDPTCVPGGGDWWHHAQYRYVMVWWNVVNNAGAWNNCGQTDHYYLHTRLETIGPGDPEYFVCECPFPLQGANTPTYPGAPYPGISICGFARDACEAGECGL